MKNYIKPEEYVELDEYAKINDNPLGRFLHKKRFDTINKLVKKYSYKNDEILDICCGLCEWNIDKIKIKGLDVNKKALKIAQKSGRIREIILTDALKNNLADNSFNMIISSQALEHLENPSIMLKEFKRLLKKRGILVIAVPYDTFFSLIRPLMFMRYIWNGIIKGNKYFLNKGGHINHFSPKSLSILLRKNNFSILKIVNDFRFTFTIVAQNMKNE